MRSSGRAHLVACVVAAAGVAVAQPAPGGGSGAPPAASGPVASGSIPPVAPSPARFAVAPFENRARVRAFDWLVAGAAFEVASKTEDVLGLAATGGPLFVGGTHVRAEPARVAAFAAQHDARWVITGWVERPNWTLDLSITVWKVERGTASIAGEARRTGPVPSYHALLGAALAEAWVEAGVPLDPATAPRLARPLAADPYAVTLMGRGLGYLTGALAPDLAPVDPVAAAAARGKQLALAQHDLERAVFIDPKLYEAHRLLGELYLVLAAERSEPKLVARAAGKFAHASELAPDDLQAMRAAGRAAADASKHEVARALFTRLLGRRPWDLDARYQLGRALWQLGQADAAQRQLEQVTEHAPDHVAARRVLVLIHAARRDTVKLVGELELIAQRAPADLDVKAELATAYGALGRWDRATAELEAIALARPADLALLVRIGDGHRKRRDLTSALAWYARAAKVAPDSSLPGFAAAQALLDAGQLVEATRAYLRLQRFKLELPDVEQALGVLALAQARPDEAAWYLRRATRGAPRNLLAWRALVAAELARHDAALALATVDRALVRWPRDVHLGYLAAIAHAQLDRRTDARARLAAIVDADPDFTAARDALRVLDGGGTPTLQYAPVILRPWGDAEVLADELARYALIATTLATVRTAYQTQLLGLLGALGRGPYAPGKPTAVRACPVGRVAPMWASAQQLLRRYEQLGVELEAAYRYIARHDQAGLSAGLLPTARAQVSAARRTFRTALADVGELRGEWSRDVLPELRLAGCTDKLLAIAAASPERYRGGTDDRPPPIPAQEAPRARPRATFYVDNTGCPDPVEVWIDGTQLGQVAPDHRSALVADGGERTLCLLGPGAARCGDRGTVRRVYLHEGWSVTLHCPRAP